MLYELFSWVKRGEVEPRFGHTILTRLAFDSEYQLALNQRRALRATLHTARLTSPETVTAVSDRLLEHDAYIHFMAFCRVELGEQASCDAIFLVLSHVLSMSVMDESSVILKTQLEAIFLYFLQENKQQAIDFYHENESQLEAFQAIKRQVAVEKTVSYLADLTTRLAHQKNAVSIASLFMQFIDDTEYFAAAILWLLRRGVSTERIIQTYLLQHFMLYHAAWLDSADDSPIHYLYQLMQAFPEARDLVEVAGKIQCEDRSFHCDEGGHQSLSITGVLTEQSLLQRIEIKIASLDFTPTTENFSALYQLFGSKFLDEALIWSSQYQHALWGAALKDVLNQEESIHTFLPAFINLAATERSPSVLEALADMMDEDTIETLVVRRAGAVFHFLPYKPWLSLRIGEEDIEHYLCELGVDDRSVLDVIPQFLSLFHAFRDKNKVVAGVVYEAIIDIVLHSPQLLDDAYLIKQLKKFSDKEIILTNRSASLQSQFDQCLEEQRLIGMLTTEGYHHIEDAWHHFSQQMDLLNEIMPLTSRCPPNKYILWALLANMYNSSFVLDDFVEALEVRPELVGSTVNEYERLLIELLTTLDDEVIRQDIIDKFEAHDEKKSRWMSMRYEDESVFDRAVRQGNVGLIRWLETKITMDLDHAVILGAQAHQWRLVAYFCSTSQHRPQQSVLKDLLSLAATEGQLSVVQLLCEDAIVRLKTKYREQAFVSAAAKGHRDIVEYLHYIDSTGVSISILANALKVAMQSSRFDVVDFIGNLPVHPEIVRACEQLLSSGPTRDQLHVVQQLCRLKNNSPSLEAIEKAFLRAVEYGRILIVQYLCELDQKAPRRHVVEKGLQAAIKSGDVAIVHYLSPMIGPQMGMRMIEYAVKQGELALTKYFCELNPPGRQFLYHSLKKITSKKNQAIADYFRSLLASESPPKRPLDSIDEELSTQRESVSPIDEGRGSLLSAFGLFGSRGSSPKPPPDGRYALGFK